MYLVKYDSSGNVKWGISTNTITSTFSPFSALGLATNLFGDVYVLGMHDTTITLGGHTLLNPGPKNHYYFIAKIDSQGNTKWIKNLGNLACRYFEMGANEMTVDASGNLVMALSFTGSPVIGADTFINAATDSSSDIFVGKFDSSGSLLWGRSYGGRKYDLAHGISVAPSGSLYVLGDFQRDTITFGASIIHDTSSNVSHWSIFVAKFDSLGNPIWARSSTGPGSMYTHGGITSEGDDNVYIVGNSYTDTVNFGSATLLPAPASQAIVAKFDSSAVMQWTKIMTGSFIIPYDLEKDACDNIWVCATMGNMMCTDTVDGHIINSPARSSDPIFIAGWTPAGTYLHDAALASGGDDLVSIATDQCGNIYVEGDYNIDSFVVGGDTLRKSVVGSGSEYNFVARFNPDNSCYCINESSVKEIAHEDLIIYPNPVEGNLYLKQNNSLGHIVIYNFWGQEIYNTFCCSNNIVIDMSPFASGMYLIRINDSEVRKMSKL